jgi:Protein of unknown function (DUF3298)
MKKSIAVLCCLILNVFFISAEVIERSFKKLSGKIDTYDITMFITITPEIDKKAHTIANLKGTYYYNRVGEPIEIYGYQTEKGNYNFTEFSMQPDAEHQWSLTKKELNFAGVWMHVKTKKKLTVQLSEVVDNNLNFQFEHYKVEDCSGKKAVLKRLKVEPTYIDSVSFIDTLCSVHELSAVKYIGTEPTAQKINQAILNELSRIDTLEIAKPSKYNSFKAYGESIIDFGDYPLIEQTEDITVYYIDEKRIIFKFYTSTYGGGAHPNTSEVFLNLDRQTGKVILLKDILDIKKWNKKMKTAIMLQMQKMEIWNDTWFADEKKGAEAVTITTDYALLPNGILFWYNPYAAAAYAFGPIPVFVKYSDIDSSLK